MPQFRLGAGVSGICAATAVASAVTLATSAGVVGLGSLAATPKRLAEGKVWLLLTSALVADRPWLPSLLGFAIVGLAACRLAPGRIVALAALAGHVLATVAVYSVLGIARAIDAEAFGSLLHQPDIGLSAIIAAWIGVVAQALWKRHRSARARILTALGCAGCMLIGVAFRPDLNALDSEHFVAFALGVAIAAWWPNLSSLAGSNQLRIVFASTAE